MKTSCPECFTELNVSETNRGRKIRCPDCQTVFSVIEELDVRAIPQRKKRAKSNRSNTQGFSPPRVMLIVLSIVLISALGIGGTIIVRRVVRHREWEARQVAQRQETAAALKLETDKALAEARTWRTIRDPGNLCQFEYRGRTWPMSVQTVNGKVTSWEHVSVDVDNGDSFTVARTNPPPIRKPLSFKERLDGAIAFATSKPGRLLVSRRDFKLGDYHGSEIRVDIENRTFTRVRQFCVGDDTITVTFGTPDATRISSVGQKFLDSIRLLDAQGLPDPNARFEFSEAIVDSP